MKHSLSDLELIALRFRRSLNVLPTEPVDPFKWDVSDVVVTRVSDLPGVAAADRHHLLESAASSWSAMSVPLDPERTRWAVVVNERHPIERQRVSLLEEYWHIFLGHEVTKIMRSGDSFGRSYETQEEHDAFYLAAATLLPKAEVERLVRAGARAENIGASYGVSKELVEYRIKRRGLWREYSGRKIEVTRR